MMKRKEKGTYGYIRQQQIYTILRTVLLFTLALGLYAIGYVTTGTNKNLLTIIAILGILPGAKSMVNMIMFLRFRSISADAYERYEATGGGSHVLYENILTTTQQAYFLPAIFCKNHTVCSFCEKAGELKALEDQITETLKQEKIEATVRIFPDERLFIKRLQEMTGLQAVQNDENDREEIYKIIKAMSL